MTELRNEMSSKLKNDLVPQQFVQLDELPVGDDGKIDRKQLLDPFAPVDYYIPPRSKTEKRLEKIWQGVLGVSRVSLNENFFDIGGHSLISIRVIVKVKKEFGVRLDQAKMVLLTLEQMAREIDENLQTDRPDSGVSSSEQGAVSHRESKSATQSKPNTDLGHAAPEEKGDSVNSKKGLFARFKKSK